MMYTIYIDFLDFDTIALERRADDAEEAFERAEEELEALRGMDAFCARVFDGPNHMLGICWA